MKFQSLYPKKSLLMIRRASRVNYLLWRYGVMETAAELGWEITARSIKRVRGKNRASDPQWLQRQLARRLGKVFMLLGPTYIKLGQMLASRPDQVGDIVAEELESLYSKVDHMPFGETKKILCDELKISRLGARFQKFVPEPIGSASLAQVHRAELLNGTEVVVKIQKSGVDTTVQADLLLLGTWVELLSRVLPQFDLKHAYLDFKKATLDELDYTKEKEALKRFRKNAESFFHSQPVVFPMPFEALCTKKVLVMSPMQGKSMGDLKQGSTVARKAAVMSIQAVLIQIFEHGLFHADPHAGNLFFLEENGGKVGFIDLGMVGRLEQEDRKKFLKCLMAILKRDKKGVASALFALGTAHKKTDYARFEAEIFALINSIDVNDLSSLSLHTMIQRLLKVARSNRIHIPNRYILMLRSFVMIDGLARELDPSLSLSKIAPPVIFRSLLKSYSPF